MNQSILKYHERESDNMINPAKLALIPWGLGILLTQASCFSGPDHGSPVNASDLLRVQLSTEPISLDPGLAEDGVSLRVIDNIFDGLVGYDGEGKLVNRLAESYEISPDGKTYTFKIREHALWSDGVPIRAQDFVVALRRGADPKSQSKLTPMLSAIKNYREFHAGHVAESELGVREQNGKLVIELARPAPYFLQALTIPLALPVRKDILDAHAGRWPEDAPTTGPYRITERRVGTKILLEANANYWGKATAISPVISPVISKVELLIISDESTGTHLFESGKLDIVTKVPAPEMKRWRAGGLLHTDPFAATYYIAFNTQKAPFQSRDFRRAIAGVIERAEIAASLDAGDTPARSWIPIGIEGYLPYENPEPVFADSIAAVQKLKVKPAPIEASFDSSGKNSQIMEKIQSDVERRLGLKISLSNLDWKTHVKSMQTDATPIYRFGWLTPFLDPVPHLQLFSENSTGNFTHWTSPIYDELVKKIEALKPGPERLKLIKRAQTIIVDDEAIVVPILHYAQTHLVSARIDGFRVNQRGAVRFDELRFKKN